MFWAEQLKKPVLAVLFCLLFSAAAMADDVVRDVHDAVHDDRLLPMGVGPAGYDMTPIDAKTSHKCLTIFTADDEEFPVGLTNACQLDIVVTSIQLAEVTGKPPVWKEAPLGITPRPTAMLDPAGDSCFATIGFWEMVGFGYTRSCKEVILRSVNAIHIAAPPFKHLRISGYVGKETFEASAVTIDVIDLKATAEFRKKFESKR